MKFDSLAAWYAKHYNIEPCWTPIPDMELAGVRQMEAPKNVTEYQMSWVFRVWNNEGVTFRMAKQTWSERDEGDLDGRVVIAKEDNVLFGYNLKRNSKMPISEIDMVSQWLDAQDVPTTKELKEKGFSKDTDGTPVYQRLLWYGRGANIDGTIVMQVHEFLNSFDVPANIRETFAADTDAPITRRVKWLAKQIIELRELVKHPVTQQIVQSLNAPIYYTVKTAQGVKGGWSKEVTVHNAPTIATLREGIRAAIDAADAEINGGSMPLTRSNVGADPDPENTF